MYISQLEAVIGIVKCGYNMSAAAERLERSQSGMSRQIKELERELTVRIFTRTKNKIVGLTPQGQDLMEIGQRMVNDARNLRMLTTADVRPAQLRIATTHINARYSLPRVLKEFTVRHPSVQLSLQQGDPRQCCDAVASGEADIAVATVPEKVSEKIVAIPTYKLSRCVVVPKRHPLTREKTLTLKKLIEYPFITYSSAYPGRHSVDEAFEKAKLQPHVVCTGLDADVCKTYVELGLGIAVLGKIAFDQQRDVNLTAIETGNLFKAGTLALVFRKHAYVSQYMRSFISMFAPHIDASIIRKALEGGEVSSHLLQEARMAKI